MQMISMPFHYSQKKISIAENIHRSYNQFKDKKVVLTNYKEFTPLPF